MKLFEMIIVGALTASPMIYDEDSNPIIHVTKTELPGEYDAICSIVDIASPIYTEDDVALSNVQTTANIFVLTANSDNEKWLSATSLNVYMDDGQHLSGGCLPLNTLYRVEVTINYHPEDGVSLCPKQIKIENLYDFFLKQENEH